MRCWERGEGAEEEGGARFSDRRRFQNVRDGQQPHARVQRQRRPAAVDALQKELRGFARRAGRE